MAASAFFSWACRYPESLLPKTSVDVSRINFPPSLCPCHSAMTLTSNPASHRGLMRMALRL
jgi:hypothetical protein